MDDQTAVGAVAGELVTETLEYDGGRNVTVYVPPDPPDAVVFVGDGHLTSQWAELLEAADVPSTTRRLLDEANDHLRTAAELEATGMPRIEAEREVLRRFRPPAEMTRDSWRRPFSALLLETLRASVLLGGCGLVAVGLSGVVVAVMNALFGRSFVGGATVLGTGGSTVAETAQDAVVCGSSPAWWGWSSSPDTLGCAAGRSLE